MTTRRSPGGPWRTATPIVLAAALLGLAAPPAAADTIAGADAAAASATTLLEVFVDEGGVRAELETGVPDLIAFEGVLPDDFRVRMGLDPSDDDERVARFFAEELVLSFDGGAPLPGRRTAFRTDRRWPRDGLTGGPVAGAPGGGRPVAVVGFACDLAGRPARLRLTPAMVSGGRPKATAALVVHHLGVPVIDATALTGPVVVELDWDQPWRSRLLEPELGRELGEPLVAQLSVEPGRVWLELVARPHDIEPLEEPDGEAPAAATDAARWAVARRLAERLVAGLELTIDGEPATPVLHRAELVERRLIRSSTPGSSADPSAGAAFLRAVFVRSLETPAERVELVWRRRPAGLAATGVVIGSRGAVATDLATEESRLCWSADDDRVGPMTVAPPPSPALRPLLWLGRAGLAVIALLLVGAAARAAGGAGSWARTGALAGLAAALAGAVWLAGRAVTIDDARAGRIIAATLHNLYLTGAAGDRAGLGPGVAQGLVDEVSAAARRPLELAGGDRDLALFREVEVVAVSARPRGRGFEARCRWSVVITVGHWGHAHRRVAPVAAELVFEPVDGVWVLTGWSPLEPAAG
ncbi:MAG: hypothetical protein MUC56_05955 [Thermoanaerobaculales bacterium]|jgi:hypothetical protein|nr:hypothetical protein [Thermoanaerobaculales bacterium]